MSDETLPDAGVEHRPTALARRYRQYHPVSTPILDDMLLSVGDLAVRIGDDSLLTRALSTDPEVRGDLPFLLSMKIGRSRRIRGKRAKEWLDAVEARFTDAFDK